MAFDHNPVHSTENGGIKKPLFEGRGRVEEEGGNPLGGLEEDVSGKSVADYDVDFSLKDIFSFDIADEVGHRLELFVGFLECWGPFFRFRSDVEEADFRMFDAAALLEGDP